MWNCCFRVCPTAGEDAALASVLIVPRKRNERPVLAICRHELASAATSSRRGTGTQWRASALDPDAEDGQRPSCGGVLEAGRGGGVAAGQIVEGEELRGKSRRGAVETRRFGNVPELGGGWSRGLRAVRFWGSLKPKPNHCSAHARTYRRRTPSLEISHPSRF